MAIVTLNPEDYSLPDFVREACEKPIVKVNETIVEAMAEKGATWETLEAKFLVHKEDLQRIVSVAYTQGRERFKDEMLRKIIDVATEDRNPVLLKFIGSTLLDLNEKTTIKTETETGPVDEEALNIKINSLLKKHAKK